MEQSYRISRPGYLPIGYIVYQPKPPVDEYVAPQPKKEPFFPGGPHNGKVRLSRTVPQKHQHLKQSRDTLEPRPSRPTAGRVILWIVLLIFAAPLVLVWAILKLARPNEK